MLLAPTDCWLRSLSLSLSLIVLINITVFYIPYTIPISRRRLYIVSCLQLYRDSNSSRFLFFSIELNSMASMLFCCEMNCERATENVAFTVARQLVNLDW